MTKVFNDLFAIFYFFSTIYGGSFVTKQFCHWKSVLYHSLHHFFKLDIKAGILKKTINKKKNIISCYFTLIPPNIFLVT